MKRLVLLALVGCGTDPAGGASIVLDIPNGVLDPKGYTTVQITLHEDGGDVVRSATVGADGGFDLGDMDPSAARSIEAALRDDGSAVVGYGRTPASAELAAGATITIPIRRPIVYFAGPSLTFTPPNTITWHGAQPTFSDLSTGAALDGSTQLTGNAAVVVAAGPQLFTIDQPVTSATGALSGMATIRSVSTADHVVGQPLSGTMTGAVQDAAGSDDGATVVVGTQAKLYVVDAHMGAATPIREAASGDFGRVAVVSGADGAVSAVAIKSRGSTTAATCNMGAQLVWIGGAGGGEVADVRQVGAAGGFSDVASDGGRAWYVDACKGELGEVTASELRVLRTGLGTLGRPTALAVSNGRAWIGFEKQAPVPTLSLAVVPLEAASTPPRVLWTELQEQVVSATQFPGVERRLTAVNATYTAIEVGAGDDYVAAAIAGDFHGNRVSQANFPDMTIQTEELRVFDAASGGSVQRYRSWCDGSFTTLFSNDIDDWSCTTSTGQTGPRNGLEHRIGSMAFQFGKK